MNSNIYICSVSLLLLSLQTKASEKKQERPNILWLTFEDTSSYEFGCYGNNQVHTPNICLLYTSINYKALPGKPPCCNRIHERTLEFSRSWHCRTDKYIQPTKNYHWRRNF